MDGQPSLNPMPASKTDADGLDVRSNRAARKYTPREMALRVLWIPGQYLLRLSPRPAYGWRRLVLRLFGARVGKDVHVHNSTRVTMPWNLSIGDWAAVGEDALIYNLGPVTIGDRATVSHRAHLCAGTHDYRRPDLPLLPSRPSRLALRRGYVRTRSWVRGWRSEKERSSAPACCRDARRPAVDNCRRESRPRGQKPRVLVETPER